MSIVLFYCVKCRKKVSVKGSEKVKLKNRSALKAKCPVCSCVIYKFVKA